MSGLVPLIETTRGEASDLLHFGAIAVSDARGRVVASAGDPKFVAFTRSTIKALQALPLLMSGGAKQLGLTQRNIALLCASHSGEPMHVAEVDEILARAGVGRMQLQCGCHVPFHALLEVGRPAPPTNWDERHHNCSGKHSGFLAFCAAHGLPIDTYLEPSHPLQQSVRRDLARACGLAQDALKLGIDGCCAPNYALPLAALAHAFARVARGAKDEDFGPAFETLVDAMVAHPELVSGTGRNDLAYMRAGRGDWITKVGADGLQVVASRSRGEALVVKIVDGNPVALNAATVAALDQLGWLDEEQRAELSPWRAAVVTNWRGLPVGERRAAFGLSR